MEMNCIEYFLYSLKIFFWSVATLSPQDGAMAAPNILPENGLGHVIARQTHRPTSHTWRVAVRPYLYDCAVTAELHVGLGYNNKVGCGHGSRTWQLMQQAAYSSFARNHWLE